MSAGKHLVAPGRRSWKQRLVIATGTTLSAILLMGATATGYVYYRYGQITRFAVPIDLASNDQPQNYLLVGSDTRENLDPDDPANARFFESDGSVSGLRTDTIMILRIDPEAGTASLMSLPRDLFVPIAGTGKKDRINSAFSLGRDVLIDTIKENFGIPIHHYIEVDFVGFQELVSAIGGVAFYFEEPVRDRHSGLFIPQSGCINLVGDQALAFARSRYLERKNAKTGKWEPADGIADLGRMSRQQEFIRKAISRAVSKGLSDPFTLKSLIDTGVSSVGLDPTLGISEITDLGRRFADFDADTLLTYTLPVENFRTSGGAAVVRLNDREAEPIFNIFRGLPPDDLRPDLITVTVLNGTGRPGLASDVTGALSRVGFQMGTPANTKEPQAASVLFHSSGSENAARRVARHLSAPIPIVVDDSVPAGEVVLVVGPDFTTVHDQPAPTVADTSTTAGGSESPTTTAAPTPTTSEPPGYVPDEAPAGVACN